jgi:hypothetical protein
VSVPVGDGLRLSVSVSVVDGVSDEERVCVSVVVAEGVRVSVVVREEDGEMVWVIV